MALTGYIWHAEWVIITQKMRKSWSTIALFRSLHLFVLLSVFGPQGLRLVRLTDVSLLVEWEPVFGAEYFILTYHPKDDERALQQVAHKQMSNQENRKDFWSRRHLSHQRFEFRARKSLTSSLGCLLGSPTSSRCTPSSRKCTAKRTSLRRPQVSTDRQQRDL